MRLRSQFQCLTSRHPRRPSDSSFNTSTSLRRRARCRRLRPCARPINNRRSDNQWGGFPLFIETQSGAEQRKNGRSTSGCRTPEAPPDIRPDPRGPVASRRAHRQRRPFRSFRRGPQALPGPLSRRAAADINSMPAAKIILLHALFGEPGQFADLRYVDRRELVARKIRRPRRGIAGCRCGTGSRPARSRGEASSVPPKCPGRIRHEGRKLPGAAATTFPPKWKARSSLTRTSSRAWATVSSKAAAVVVQFCGHAGIVNMVKQAQEVRRRNLRHHGGFDLAGSAGSIWRRWSPRSAKLQPEALVPMHRSGQNLHRRGAPANARQGSWNRRQAQSSTVTA